MKHFFLDYIDFITLEKGLSDNTVLAYKRDIKESLVYFEKLGINHWKYLEKAHIYHYIEDKSKRYKRSTLVRKLTALRQFMLYLRDVGEISGKLCGYGHGIKREKNLVETLSIEEIESIQQAIGISPSEKRDAMIIALLIYTGARISEIVTLTIENIDFQSKTVTFMSKGGKYRVLPLSDTILEKLNRYLQRVQRDIDQTESYRLFHISRNYFWKRLQGYALKAGIKKSVYPHMFRHTVATLLLDEGANIRVVQEFLGHSSIATTENYTHVEKKTIKKLYEMVGIGDE